MKETRSTSPFASKPQRDELEKWICRQHQQQELPQEMAHPPELCPADEPEPQPRRIAPPVQPAYQPSHRQYDAIISKMRSARRQAAQDQHWSG